MYLTVSQDGDCMQALMQKPRVRAEGSSHTELRRKTFRGELVELVSLQCLTLERRELFRERA